MPVAAGVVDDGAAMAAAALEVALVLQASFEAPAAAVVVAEEALQIDRWRLAEES